MIVVTGATGHIGNVLVRELLEKGQQVRVVLRPDEDTTSIRGLDTEWFYGDVRDMDSLLRAFKDADMVYHLAGIVSISKGQRKLLHDVNVNGTKNVVDACIKAGVRRLIYTSSVHALFEPPHGTVIDESFPFDPKRVIGDYAKSKASATLEIFKGIEKGLDAVIVCPTGVIGPYDYRVSEIGHLILDFISRKLKAYIDGAYDFVDVRDVAHGLVLASETGKTGESYLLSGERITVKGIFDVLEKVTNIKPPSFKVPLWIVKTAALFTPLYYKITGAKPRFTSYSIKVLQSNCVISSKKAVRELGYNPRPIAESLADSIKWFKQAGVLQQ